mmetsp:Transcript_28709/g.66690  ORF Transcript_28709/g.66690 Transcript_28709/m.66690 type:complete len:194 (-) Transcript_28709:29-610(-)
MHIRGTLYENAHSDVSADPQWILSQVSPYLPQNSTIYIATDEADQEVFFAPFKRAGYRLAFASDFRGVMDSLMPWHMEMVEQLVCARAEVFVGTYYSSFSGYITRLRGYYGQRDRAGLSFQKERKGEDRDEDDGEEEESQNGELLTTYYHTPENAKKELRMYRAIRNPFNMREFPTAWRNLNYDVHDEVDKAR